MQYQTTIHRVGKRKADNTNFNLTIALIVACVVTACSLVGFGQDATKASDKPIVADSKKAPESVTLSADVVKELQNGAKDARIAQLEYENLAREIKLAEARLKDLQTAAKTAQDTANGAFRAACIKAGIPASDVEQYEGSPGADGTLTLKRKAAK